MSALDVVGAMAVVAVVVAALRWPGRMLGLGAALALWLVGPWATWLALAVTGAAVLAWRLWGRQERLVWLGVGWLVARPPLAVMVTAGGVIVFGPAGWGPWAFAVLLAAGVWAAWSWPPVEPRRFGGLPAAMASLPARVAGRPGRGLEGPQERAEHVMASGPCPRCGGLAVVSVRVPEGPGGPDLAGVVARAACPDCGARLVGVMDPARPAGGLVWMDMPEGPRAETWEAR